jgi:uncharacterized protein YbjT (DUF2867 family)
MKVVIPGGTGQIGAVVGRSQDAVGHEVVMLTRRRALLATSAGMATV